MNAYLILLIAIVFEVCGTMLLPITGGFTKWVPTGFVLISYGLSFYCLSLITHKIPLAILYASWAGLGVFAITVLSYLVYQQSLNWQSILGLVLIVIGVVLVNTYTSGHHSYSPK